MLMFLNEYIKKLTNFNKGGILNVVKHCAIETELSYWKINRTFSWKFMLNFVSNAGAHLKKNQIIV